MPEEEPKTPAALALCLLDPEVKGAVLFELGQRIDNAHVRVQRYADQPEHTYLAAAVPREIVLKEAWQAVWEVIDASMGIPSMLIQAQAVLAFQWFVEGTNKGETLWGCTRYMVWRLTGLDTREIFTEEPERPMTQAECESCAIVLTRLAMWEQLDEMLEHGWEQRHLDAVLAEKSE